MSYGFVILVATGAAGLIAGAGLHTFMAAAAAAACAVWLFHIRRPTAQTLYANLDPQNPDGTFVLEAFREALAFISRTRRPVLLRITAFTRNAHPVFQLTLTRDGDLDLARDSRHTALKQPGVWLPEHPLPLTLPPDRSITLLLEPCGPERVRASLAGSASRPPCHGSLPLLLAAAACALDIDWLLAVALGFAFQAYLPQYQPRRTSYNAKIQRG